jgi:hypothetical protein
VEGFWFLWQTCESMLVKIILNRLRFSLREGLAAMSRLARRYKFVLLCEYEFIAPGELEYAYLLNTVCKS